MAAGASLPSAAAPARARRAGRVLGLGTLASLFAGRGWEGHALNLRNHYWSKTADPATLSFDTYLDDVVAGIERIGPNPVVVGHGMGGLLVLKAAVERSDVAGVVLVDAELPAELRRTGPAVPRARCAGRLRPRPDRLGRAAREAPAGESRPHT